MREASVRGLLDHQTHKASSNAPMHLVCVCPFRSKRTETTAQSISANRQTSVFLSVVTHFLPKFGPGLRRRGNNVDARDALPCPPLGPLVGGTSAIYPLPLHTRLPRPCRPHRHHPLSIAWTQLRPPPHPPTSPLPHRIHRGPPPRRRTPLEHEPAWSFTGTGTAFASMVTAGGADLDRPAVST